MVERNFVFLRRARALQFYWVGNHFVFENYGTRQASTADRLALEVLAFFDDWRQPEELIRHLRGEYSARSVHRSLRQLVAHGLLFERGSAAANDDERLASVWKSWLPHAGYHFATKDAPFLNARRAACLMREYLAESKQPAFYKNYSSAPQIALPQPVAPSREFRDVLLGRRTHRSFSDAPVALEALASLLYYTWGETSRFPSVFGSLLRKTSPSGGARHPGEVYVLANRVEDLRPGLYHYSVQHHRLELLRAGRMAYRGALYCAGQGWVKGAAALFLMTAVFPRTMWKYRNPRAYRVVLLDAGHLCQSFCLVATWLGLGPFCTAAIKDTMIERDLEIDGVSESILYLAGVGVPSARSSRRRLGASL